ncbi:MAG: hypothetical protein HND48_02660 [Chloroflexi bacterium]|nr:hypothetical protein [Chloroflexota bacterium]
MRAASYNSVGMSLQAGEEKHHVVADRPPHRCQDDAVHSRAFAHEPRHVLNAEYVEVSVHQAEVFVEDPRPQHADDGRHDDERHKDRNPAKRPAAPRLVQEEREGKAEDDQRGNRDDHEEHRIAERGAE